MTVDELIAELQLMPKDAEVHFAYNYGDHWRTQVAPTVDSVDMGKVKFSDYHRMPKVDEGDDDYDDEDRDYSTDDTEGQVVILR
jgi:hypothetical protein